ncbi:MAG TPA: nicotinate (nicotinamide) nucleotide adenylyltransferase [Burkholderiaceae bacterium]|nr:nicotinate (nicotinamide) nucleotide adenylyltransferase [Burkholderiaceae bacterium]
MPSPIGVLGGTFDPVHNGHLALARAACERLQLSQLLLVPAGHPWQKGDITDGRHRARMLELAIAGDSRMSVDRCELERSGPSYTIDTLRELRARVGAGTPLVLVIGADQMEGFDTWRDWQSILHLAHLGVARRNDAVLVLSYPLQAFYNEHWARLEAVHADACGHVVEIDMVPHDVSATEVRALLRAAQTPAGEVRLARIIPAAVLDYIRAHRLYT